MTAPTLSVGIATYRRPAGLKRLLASVVDQGRVAGRQIVVVNDGSHDDAYQSVKAEFGDVITYRALPRNVGIAAARNACVDLAQGDYIVFIDDDCVAPSWWLDWLAARLAAAPELDVVAGTTRPLWQEGRRGFMARVQAHYGLLPHPRVWRDTVLFVTANVALRRSAVKAAGGFGFPGFTGVSEDTELSNRLAQRGAAMRIDHDWHVFHEVSNSLPALCRRYWRYGFANGAHQHLTTASQVYDGLYGYRRAMHPRALKLRHDAREPLRASFSASRIENTLSAWAADVVSLAYLEGVAAGSKQHRASRRQPISR